MQQMPETMGKVCWTFFEGENFPAKSSLPEFTSPPEKLERGERGGPGPKIWCTKMARQDFPYRKFVLSHDGHCGLEGGGSPPTVYSHPNTSLAPAVGCRCRMLTWTQQRQSNKGQNKKLFSDIARHAFRCDRRSTPWFSSIGAQPRDTLQT